MQRALFDEITATKGDDRIASRPLRAAIVPVRLTEGERDQLTEVARDLGISLSTYMRQAVLSAGTIIGWRRPAYNGFLRRGCAGLSGSWRGSGPAGRVNRRPSRPVHSYRSATAGVFRFIQEFQGYISPGILTALAFGFAVPKAPPAAGVAALVLSALVYGLLQWRLGSVAYLHRMLGTFVLLLIVMAVITALARLPSPRPLPVRHDIDMSGSAAALVWGTLVIAAVLAFFVLFR